MDIGKFIIEFFKNRILLVGLIVIFATDSQYQRFSEFFFPEPAPAIVIDPTPAIVIDPTPAIVIDPTPAIIIKPDKHLHDDRYEKKNHTHSEEFDSLNELKESHGVK